MGIAPVRTYAPSVASLRIRSRALRALPFTALAIDLTLLTVTVLLAAYGRSHLPLFDADGAGPGLTHATGGPTLAYAVAMVTLPLIIGWLLIIALRGGYDHGVFGSGADEYKVVATSSLFAAGLLGIGCYLTKFQISRGFFVFTFLIGSLLLVGGRYVLRRNLHRARRRGAVAQRTLIVGSH